MSYKQASQAKNEAVRNLLSEAVSLAIFDLQYPQLGNILRYAYDQYLILHVVEPTILFLVARNETEIMRVLVKAIVQLKGKQLLTTELNRGDRTEI